MRILDARRRARSPTGVVGRVFVGSGARFDGYTGGGGKEQIDGLLSSGDLGHFDAKGRLFIDGRDDDMIVSGGENVFPAEVEELLADPPGRARGRRHRRARRGVRAAPEGVRRAAARAPRLTQADVKEHVREHLARYKVPRTVTFVDALPRTTTGKLRRLDLS